MSDIIGVLIATLVAMFGIHTYTNFQENANQSVMAATTASEWAQVNAAATSYIQQNATAIQGIATPTTPAVITIAMLQSPTVNLLPASFNALNPYQQTWQVEVLQPTAGNLQALVMTTGGQVLLDKQAGAIAQLIGASGGIIPKNDSGLYPTAGMAYGTAGSWKVPTTGYTGVSVGELAALEDFNNGQLQSPYLYRNAVPGQPQLNTMNTPLIMGAIETSGSACAPLGAIAQDGNGGILSCPTSAVWTSVGGGSWKSPVATYALLPSAGNTIGDVRMVTGLGRAFTWNGATWTALAVDQNGNLNITGVATMANADITGTATVGNACTPNGLVAQDGTGKLLSCQSGTWAANGVVSVSNSGAPGTYCSGMNYCNRTSGIGICSNYGGISGATSALSLVWNGSNYVRSGSGNLSGCSDGVFWLD